MAAWPHGWLALTGAVACEPGGGPGPGRRPGRRGGAAGVLDAPAGEPMMAGQGETAGCGDARVCGYGRPHRAAVRRGSRLAAVIPPGVPRPGGPGGMGRFASGPGAGQSHPRPRRRQGGGHTTSRPRARPGRQQVTLPGLMRGGRARRASRRTPGSAAPGPPRSWRCSAPPGRGGR